MKKLPLLAVGIALMRSGSRPERRSGPHKGLLGREGPRGFKVWPALKGQPVPRGLRVRKGSPERRATRATRASLSALCRPMAA